MLESPNLAVLFEDFRSNPFWRLFNANPVEHAFETEITFLLQHYSQIKVARGHSKRLVCDYSLIQDAAYADVNLQGGQLEAFQGVYEEAWQSLPTARLIVHLICSAKEELSRIERRAREEEAETGIGYLNALNAAIHDRVDAVVGEIPTLTIDSEQLDFAHDEEDKANVRQMILAKIDSVPNE